MFKEDTLAKLCKMSKIEMDDSEREKFLYELNKFSENMDIIKEAEVSCDKAKNKACNYELLRNDEIKKSSDREQLILNAKIVSDKCFCVPKIM